jgi:hypothetical protein
VLPLFVARGENTPRSISSARMRQARDNLVGFRGRYTVSLVSHDIGERRRDVTLFIDEEQVGHENL